MTLGASLCGVAVTISGAGMCSLGVEVDRLSLCIDTQDWGGQPAGRYSLNASLGP